MNDPGERWTSIVLTFFFGTTGLCGYILYIYVVSKNRQHRFTNPFYALTLSWSVPETYRVLQGLIVTMPILIIDLYGDSSVVVPKWYRTVTGFFSMCAWLATVSHTSTLAFNRLCAVYWPAEYRRLYTHTKCAVLLLLCYFYSVFLTSIVSFGGCRSEFQKYSWRIVSTTSLVTKLNRTELVTIEECSDVVYKIYVITWNILVLSTVLCCFAAILGVLIFRRRFNERFRRRSLRRLANQQWSLTAQFTVTVFLLAIEVGVYWAKEIFSKNDLLSEGVMDVVANGTSLCATALNPYVYILLGTMVRRQIFGLHKNESQSRVDNCEREDGSYVGSRAQICASTDC